MRRKIAVGVLGGASLAAAAVAALAADRHPGGSTSPQSSYLVPSQDGADVESIFTVGDPVGGTVAGYRIVGIPDGLGAFRDKGGTFTLLMNHEIASGGAVRAHGATGAFVSQWTIDGDDHSVLAGSDLIHDIATWNTTTGAYNAPAAGDKKSRTGLDGRLFMNGEEGGTERRAFAHGLDGTSYQPPALGRFSWENSVAHPSTGRKTVVVGLDDSTPGQVYVYVGDKKTAGSPAGRAGLTGGTLYGSR